MSDPDVVVIGEAVVDLVPLGGRSYDAAPGGSPTNVAVGLARQGDRVEHLVRIGAGAFGATIRDHLLDNRVGMQFAVEAEENATVAVVALDDTGQATYTFYADGTSDWGWTVEEVAAGLACSPRAVVAGSITLARQPGADVVAAGLRAVAGGDATIVLDPNLRPSLIGTAEQEQTRWDALVGVADVVKVSDEDLAWLYPGRDPEDVARTWAAAGPSLVVVTLGGEGALAVAPGGLRVRTAAVPVDVVDTVGAGDAFTAGLVHALGAVDLLGGARREALRAVDEATVAQLLRWAGTTAAIVCGRRGADPPTAEQVRAAVPAG